MEFRRVLFRSPGHRNWRLRGCNLRASQPGISNSRRATRRPAVGISGSRIGKRPGEDKGYPNADRTARRQAGRDGRNNAGRAGRKPGGVGGCARKAVAVLASKHARRAERTGLSNCREPARSHDLLENHANQARYLFHQKPAALLRDDIAAVDRSGARTLEPATEAARKSQLGCGTTSVSDLSTARDVEEACA